jgi:hypothetical protein
MLRVTLLMRERCKGGMAFVVVLTFFCSGVRSARAGDSDPPGPSTDSAKSPPVGADTATDKIPPEAAAVPRLQLQDEGPAAIDRDTARLARSRVVMGDADERPFWKDWKFWTITGALVVGVVGLVAYTSSKTNSSMAPCPNDVLFSLGCYGAGREQ